MKFSCFCSPFETGHNGELDFLSVIILTFILLMEEEGLVRLSQLTHSITSSKVVLSRAWDFLSLDEFLTPDEQEKAKQVREALSKFNRQEVSSASCRWASTWRTENFPHPL